jgi:predicted nuclease of predicted toxin-antitoxin system
MRILVDECAPQALKAALVAGGYDCTTVQEAGWSGKENGELLDLAEASFEVVVTIDRNLRCQQNLTGRRIALLIVRAVESCGGPAAALLCLCRGIANHATGHGGRGWGFHVAVGCPILLGWGSLRPCVAGEEGVVEIESEGRRRRRERVGTALEQTRPSQNRAGTRHPEMDGMGHMPPMEAQIKQDDPECAETVSCHESKSVSGTAAPDSKESSLILALAANSSGVSPSV